MLVVGLQSTSLQLLMLTSIIYMMYYLSILSMRTSFSCSLRSYEAIMRMLGRVVRFFLVVGVVGLLIWAYTMPMYTMVRACSRSAGSIVTSGGTTYQVTPPVLIELGRVYKIREHNWLDTDHTITWAQAEQTGQPTLLTACPKKS